MEHSVGGVSRNSRSIQVHISIPVDLPNEQLSRRHVGTLPHTTHRASRSPRPCPVGTSLASSLPAYVRARPNAQPARMARRSCTALLTPITLPNATTSQILAGTPGHHTSNAPHQSR